MSRYTARQIDNNKLLEEAKEMSIQALANKYQVNYTTIFKRLHKNPEYKNRLGRPPKIEIN